MGHGYVSSPPSRQLYCKLKGGSPYWPNDGSGLTDRMCKKAFDHVAQKYNDYDLARVQFVQMNEFASLVGEGFNTKMKDNLCGGGASDAYAQFGDKSGFSVPGKWFATVVEDENLLVEWCVTAHHIGGYLEYYITKEDVDVDSTPLLQSHFELLKREENTVLEKCHSTEACPAGQFFRSHIKLPIRPKDKQFVILARWQRRVEADGSTEGFYNCFDLVYEKQTAPPTKPPVIGGKSIICDFAHCKMV